MLNLALGAIELTVLDDGVLPYPARAFFRNVDEAVFQATVRPSAEGRIPVGHNCLLVRSAGELIIVDTGYGEDTHGGRTGHLLEELERAGIVTADVTCVVNTHAHGDHVKGNTRVRDGRRVPTFPRARYVIGRADWDWFQGDAGRVHEFGEQVEFLRELDKLTFADGELRLTSHVALLPTPGHTPGHTSVVIESEGRLAIFLGDVCHHTLHFAHPDWLSDFDTHPALVPEMRAKVARLAAERDALLICPHAPPPGIGRLRATREGYVWQAAA